MKIIDYFAVKLGYVKKSKINEQLNFARSVGKRLDEHRELVEAIEEKTNFFEEYKWHVGHCAIQDDYLMRLYHIVHDEFPSDVFVRQKTGEVVRSRPKILGKCRLPEIQNEEI